MEDALPRLDYTASPNDSVIIEGIAANPTSLGWVGFAFVEENLDANRPIPVDGGGGCVQAAASRSPAASIRLPVTCTST